MSHTPGRGRRAIAGLATLGALVFAAPAVAAPFPTACTNTVTNNNTQVDVTEMSATVPASVKPNTDFGVTGIHGVVKIPGSVFIAGYNLELIDDGDQVSGTIQMILGATNTTQLTQPSSTFPFQTTIHINDPDGTPHNGDETSQDALVPFQFDDMAWTSGPDESQMDFSMIPTAKPTKDKGGLMFTAAIPTSNPDAPLIVKFGCNPGTVEGENPGVPHYTDTAAAYASSLIKKDAPVVEPPPVTPPPSGGGGEYTIPNAFSFGKVKHDRTNGTATLPVIVPGAGTLKLAKGKVVGSQQNVREAGRYTFVIKARGKTRRKLNRKGKVKVTVMVSFTPSGGQTLTKPKTLTLKKKIAKKHHKPKHKKHKKHKHKKHHK